MSDNTAGTICHERPNLALSHPHWLAAPPAPRRSQWYATVQESEWAKGQKETRIIDTLEPVLTQHRLVVAESFLREDVATEDRNYSSFTSSPTSPTIGAPRRAMTA